MKYLGICQKTPVQRRKHKHNYFSKVLILLNQQRETVGECSLLVTTKYINSAQVDETS
jgi:hypothetical protein